MFDFSDVETQFNTLFQNHAVKTRLYKNWTKLSDENKLEVINQFSVLNFDSLAEFIYDNIPAIDKKEFIRILELYSKFPFKAIWKNKDHDIPVTVVGIMGIMDNKIFYKIADSNSGINEDELEKLI